MLAPRAAPDEEASSAATPARRRLSFIQIDGTRIRVSVRGAGSPLLLIMGLGGSIEMWEPLEKALNPLGIQTIAYDAPGTGRSPARLVPLPMSGLARQAALLLEALGHERADVLGVSFGGAIAQELALAHTQRVRRLVLTSATCGLGGIPGNPLALAELAPLRAYSPTYLRLAAEVLYGPAFAAKRGSGKSTGRPRHDRAPSLWGYFGQLAASVGWSSLSRLHRIGCPTLLIAGETDVIVPPANCRILASRIPGAQLWIVPGAGHLVVLDQPDDCAATIAEFLGHRLPTP